MTSPTPKHHPHRLLSGAQPLEKVKHGKGVLPLSSYTSAKSAFIRAYVRPGIGHLLAGRLLLATRLLIAEPQKWRVSSLRIGPRIGQFQLHGDHPALANPGAESAALLPSLPVEDHVELEVDYIGPESSGEHLVACLCADLQDDPTSLDDDTRNQQAPTIHGTDPVTILRTVSVPVAPGEKISLPLPERAHDLHVYGLTLRVAEPSHWIVNDILIGGDTLLVEAGDLPGEIFTDRPERVPLRLGRLCVKETLVVQATYTGPLPSASLAYEVAGTEVPTGSPAADSAFLPMSTGVPVFGSAQITGRVGLPHDYAFLPEEVVLRDSDKWIVNDIKIAGISLFASSGDVPGELFGAHTRGCRLHFSAVPRSVDLVIIATYKGLVVEGEPILCGVVGRVVRLPSA